MHRTMHRHRGHNSTEEDLASLLLLDAETPPRYDGGSLRFPQMGRLILARR